MNFKEFLLDKLMSCKLITLLPLELSKDALERGIGSLGLETMYKLVNEYEQLKYGKI